MAYQRYEQSQAVCWNANQFVSDKLNIYKFHISLQIVRPPFSAAVEIFLVALWWKYPGIESEVQMLRIISLVLNIQTFLQEIKVVAKLFKQIKKGIYVGFLK